MQRRNISNDYLEKIYEFLLSKNGSMDLDDKSSPEKIKKTFSMSKLSFKKALGKLLKERKIIFQDNGVNLSSHSDK